MIKSILFNSFLSTICIFALTSLAVADSASNAAKRACIKEATQDRNQAVKDAEFEMKSAKATCRFGPEVASCMTSCLPAFQSCLQPIVQSLKTCRQACGTTLVATRTAARQSLGCGNKCNTNADFQKAAIEANIASQQCNLNCRNNTDSINARAGCRTAHGLCVNACKEIVPAT